MWPSSSSPASYDYSHNLFTMVMRKRSFLWFFFFIGNMTRTNYLKIAIVSTLHWATGSYKKEIIISATFSALEIKRERGPVIHFNKKMQLFTKKKHGTIKLWPTTWITTSAPFPNQFFFPFLLFMERETYKSLSTVTTLKTNNSWKKRESCHELKSYIEILTGFMLHDPVLFAQLLPVRHSPRPYKSQSITSEPGEKNMESIFLEWRLQFLRGFSAFSLTMHSYHTINVLCEKSNHTTISWNGCTLESSVQVSKDPSLQFSCLSTTTVWLVPWN